MSLIDVNGGKSGIPTSDPVSTDFYSVRLITSATEVRNTCPQEIFVIRRFVGPLLLSLGATRPLSPVELVGLTRLTRCPCSLPLSS